MDKRSLDLLEKAFAAEINGALEGGLGLLQTRSKLADKLVESGHLVKATVRLGGRFPVTIEGYRLTILGNATYCFSDRCGDEEVTPNVELTGAAHHERE